MRRLALLLCLAAGVAPPLGQAQGINLSRGGPIDIQAQDGIEWRQEQRVVVARGGARAVRDNVTLNAERLLARYRGQGAAADTPLTGSNQIWRLEAEGGVRIATPSDTATGDRAVYDMDQAVLVLTGRELALTTREQRITASDSLEYWSNRRMAVARGNAVVVTNDGRRLGADTLVAYLPPEGAARPATTGGPPARGQLDRVELFGNVEIRTATEVVRGERAVYSAESGIARLVGNVRITRGESQVNGQEAVVNLVTGVSRLVGGAAGGARVQGVITPQAAPQQGPR